MSFIDYGNILTLLIEMFQMNEAFFKTRNIGKSSTTSLREGISHSIGKMDSNP